MRCRIATQERDHSLEEEYVVRINRPYSLFEPLVQREKPHVLAVRRLVEEVVPCHPCIVLVMLQV
jgi:hypothetical protein